MTQVEKGIQQITETMPHKLGTPYYISLCSPSYSDTVIFPFLGPRFIDPHYLNCSYEIHSHH